MRPPQSPAPNSGRAPCATATATKPNAPDRVGHGSSHRSASRLTQEYRARCFFDFQYLLILFSGKQMSSRLPPSLRATGPPFSVVSAPAPDVRVRPARNLQSSRPFWRDGSAPLSLEHPTNLCNELAFGGRELGRPCRAPFLV